MLNRLKQWLSDHRWILGMKPKGWTGQGESRYVEWAEIQPNWKALYTPKVQHIDCPNDILVGDIKFKVTETYGPTMVVKHECIIKLN